MTNQQRELVYRFADIPEGGQVDLNDNSNRWWSTTFAHALKYYFLYAQHTNPPLLVAYPVLDEMLQAPNLATMKRGIFEYGKPFYGYGEFYIYPTQSLHPIKLLEPAQLDTLYQKHIHQIQDFLTRRNYDDMDVFRTSYDIGREFLIPLFA